MKVQDFVLLFESLYPTKLAEEWDNTGLLVGSMNSEVKKVLLCLDVTADTIVEAKRIKADLIVSHHPFIFKALKKIVDMDSKQKAVMDIIKADISVISLHTNLDAASGGVNEVLAKTLELEGIENVANHKYEKVYKLCVFVPNTHADIVRESMCAAGAGFIGNYSHCTFNLGGTGTFMPLEGTRPFIGEIGAVEEVQETKIETVCTDKNMNKVIEALKKSHPYEEVAYDIYPLEIKGEGYSYGKCGNLPHKMNMEEFSKHLKKTLNLKNLRLIGKRELIEKVVVFSGSFDGNFDILKRSGADALVTGDIKYHTAVDCVEDGHFIADCGHFGTEIVVLKELKSVIETALPQTEIIIYEAGEDPFVIY